MRVLFITSRLPGDVRRGDQRRAYEQLRRLSVRHAITLIALDSDPASATPRELAACCERIVRITCARSGMLLRAALALGRPHLPLQSALYAVPALRRAVRSQLAAAPFDVVHLQLARVGPALDFVHGVPCVLDLIDSLALNMQRRAQYDRGPGRWLALMESRRLAAYERALCARVSCAAISAAPDRHALGDPPNLHLVGNGVDPDEFAFAAHPRANADIAFVGNLGYFPNVDAADWFARQVLPLVRAKSAHATLHLIGTRPARRLRTLCRHRPGVQLIGAVDSVYPYLARAAVAVAPMRAGSGQQIKIIEAMAAGTPVVASSLAAAGLGATAGRELLVADEPAMFAEAVLRVLGDPELALRLARHGRTLVEQRYTWAASVAALEQLWLRAAASARAAVASVTAAEHRANVRHEDHLPVA